MNDNSKWCVKEPATSRRLISLLTSNAEALDFGYGLALNICFFRRDTNEKLRS